MAGPSSVNLCGDSICQVATEGIEVDTNSLPSCVVQRLEARLASLEDRISYFEVAAKKGNEAEIKRDVMKIDHAMAEKCPMDPSDAKVVVVAEGEPVSQEQLHQVIEKLLVRIENYFEADRVKEGELKDELERIGERRIGESQITMRQEFQTQMFESQKKANMISRQEVEEAMLNPTHGLNESIWDTCLFVNLGFLDLRHSLTMAFCIAANYIFQVTFVYVASGMGKGDFDENLEYEMRQWRVTSGHDLKYANGDTNRPLVADICNLDNRGALMEGNRQASIFDAVDGYFEKSGSILAMLAVTLWIMTILIEVRSVSFFTSAVWYCAQNSCIKETSLIKHQETGAFVLESISWKRVAAITAFVSVPRALIAVTLGYYGVLYLVATSSPEDLILNAMALEVVLNVDEVLYAALAPVFVKEIIAGFEPLALPHSKTLLSYFPLGRVATLLSLLAFVFFWPLQEQVGIMQRVEHEMCHGDTDFVFRQDLSRQYAVHIGHADEHVSHASLGELYRQRAVLQATRQELPAESRQRDLRPTDWGNGAWMDSEDLIYYTNEDFSSVNEWLHQAQISLAQFAAAQRCTDFDTDSLTSETMKVAIRAALQEIVHSGSVVGCSELYESCLSPSGGAGIISLGDFVRLSCPETCGCNDPHSGQLLGSVFYGCPSVCQRNFDQGLQDRENCEDHSPADLHKYIQMFRREFEDVLPAQSGASDGCAYFSTPLSVISWSVGNVSVCDVEDANIIAKYGYRSVRPLCPVTCGCASARGNSAVEFSIAQCPRACNSD